MPWVMKMVANLKGHYFQPSLTVSLSVCVCVWPALLPFNVNQFWRNLITRTLLWSSLAVTMVQIGRRGTARHLFENFKNSQKSQNSNFKILVHRFLRLCLLFIVKKFWLDSNKTDWGDTFWSLPLWRFWQWHWCSSTTLGGIFWLNRRCGSVQQSQLGGILKWGHSELGERNRAVTNQPACLAVCLCIKRLILFHLRWYLTTVEENQCTFEVF